ncbi:chromate transporter [candidate division KSB1 bacterium]|nr:chromate transporter [candidate division KSB1 bacterium]
MKKLREVSFLFLKLGSIAFGGPAAHIGMFEDEVISKRKWMTRQHFLDLIGATNLIPGPNSTEMALHCGYHRAGFAGLLAAGLSFMMPAVIITGVLAHFYSRYGHLPQVEPFLYGIKPAVIVIVLQAVLKLGRKAVKDWALAVIGAAVAVMLVVAVKLGVEVSFDAAGGFSWKAMLILALSLAASLTIKKINSAMIVLGGAVAGYLLYLMN